MANKEQIQSALDQLWEKYGNTLSMLSDAIDKLDEKEAQIKELESQLKAEPEFDLDLTTPAAITQLEKTVLTKHNESK